MKCCKNLIIVLLCLLMIAPIGCQSFRNMDRSGKNALVGGAAGGAVGAGIRALI